MKRRLIFGMVTLLLLGVEIIIGMYADGWIRSYLGDVLVVILIYTLFRTISLKKPQRWYILPTLILLSAFVVEFLQLWGFCDRFGITNKFLRIIIGTGFSVIDLVSYCIGIFPCYLVEWFMKKRYLKEEQTNE